MDLSDTLEEEKDEGVEIHWRMAKTQTDKIAKTAETSMVVDEISRKMWFQVS